MRKRLSVLLWSAAVVSGIGVFATAPPATGQIDGAVPTDAARSTPPATTTLSRRGTIGSYDASTRMLSLSTSNGTVQFPLPPTARIRQGWHTLDPLELEKLAGRRAAVRYSESGDNKFVESVHVFGKNERTGP
jgi:hypothetical protein